jgi:hypothetical protein
MPPIANNNPLLYLFIVVVVLAVVVQCYVIALRDCTCSGSSNIVGSSSCVGCTGGCQCLC